MYIRDLLCDLSWSVYQNAVQKRFENKLIYRGMLNNDGTNHADYAHEHLDRSLQFILPDGNYTLIRTWFLAIKWLQTHLQEVNLAPNPASSGPYFCSGRAWLTKGNLLSKYRCLRPYLLGSTPKQEAATMALHSTYLTSFDLLETSRRRNDGRYRHS